MPMHTHMAHATLHADYEYTSASRCTLRDTPHQLHGLAMDRSPSAARTQLTQEMHPLAWRCCTCNAACSHHTRREGTVGALLVCTRCVLLERHGERPVGTSCPNVVDKMLLLQGQVDLRRRAREPGGPRGRGLVLESALSDAVERLVEQRLRVHQ